MITPTDVVCAALTVAILCCSIAKRPETARCPLGWYVNGIRPGGEYECRRAPTGDPDLDGTYGHPDHMIDHPGVVRGRIYCTGGSLPIVLTDRVVGCMR